MIKLRRLELEGFRGVRFSLSLDFGDRCRSVAVYGENGSGKSSISDALEWMIRDRVKHLQAEDCRDASFRNVLLDPDEISRVLVELSDGSSSTKTLNSSLASSHSNGTILFHELLSTLNGDRIFLSLSELTDFIIDTKTDKKKAIASIIGYDDIVNFRGVIQSTSNALERDNSYLVAKSLLETSKRDLLEHTGQFIEFREQLYEFLTQEVRKSGFEATILDADTFRSTVANLRDKTDQSTKITKKIALDQLNSGLATLLVALPKIAQASDFMDTYNELVSDKVTLNQIQLQGFLASGLKVLDGEANQPAKCPFCETSYDLGDLRQKVAGRLAAIAHITEHLKEFTNAAQSLFEHLLNLKRVCSDLGNQAQELEDVKPLCEGLTSLADAVGGTHAELVPQFHELQELRIQQSLLEKIDLTSNLAKKYSTRFAEEVLQLQFTSEETKIIALIERLQRIDRAYSSFEQNSAIIKRFQAQILTLGAIFDQFIQVQNSALQGVLDKISTDVGSFYSVLHPGENIDSVRLKITGDEGVEFEYLFHGVPTHPPRKYLSESHLNSLGLVFFLSAAKLFNKKSRFLVLDDIVTSLDSNHRRRLLRLLKEFFSEWQVLLLTHESFWFEMIRKELAPGGWQIRELSWDDENGARIGDSSKDLRVLIAAKRRKGIDVSNDLRKLTEAMLKELAVDLEVKMAFRYNDQNERRMTGELLSELRATINRKSPSLKGHPIFSHMEASSLVASVGSHDNPEAIVGADIEVALSDLDELNKLFSCSECSRNVMAKNMVPGENSITCKCGKHKIDWR